MRKLVVCNIVSLDGFYSGPDGNVMVMPFDLASPITTLNSSGRLILCFSGASRTRVSGPLGLRSPRT